MHSLPSHRLETVCALVPPCSLAADIGCDHGLAAIRLLEEGRAERVLCTDRNELPLQKARAALARAGLSGRAQFLLGDGFAALENYHPDAAVIAGLSGDTIAEILTAYPNALPGVTLVLQPMSKSSALRLALQKNGLCIEEELLARDGRRIYPVMRVFYDGLARHGAPLELLCGRQHLLRRDETTLCYLRSILAFLRQRESGRTRAGLDASHEMHLIAALTEHLNAQGGLPHDHS